MKKGKVNLLKYAKLIPTAGNIAVYNEDLHLSVLATTGQPLVETTLGITHSKTHSQHGDDDPDPGSERCY